MADNDAAPAIASRWSVMERIFQLGCGIVVSSALVAFSKERLLKVLQPTASRDYLISILGVLLLMTIVVLVFRWIFAAFGEMRLLRDYFHAYIQPQPGQVYTWAVLFSVLLGALGSLTDNIIAVSAILAVYSIGDMWGQKLRDTQLRRAFSKVNHAASEDVLRSRRRAIERYYLDRPQMERSATIMFFAFTALSLSLAGRATHSFEISQWFDVTAYTVLLMDIILSEIVICRWRKTRDTALGDKYSF
jgi:hypothetical protein